jgi:ectoine hydroxylase-related dioxygenase (phytanoyl-CoA dioxygenase family)
VRSLGRVLTASQIDDFHRDGYTVVDQLVGPDTVAALRDAYDELLAEPPATDRQLGGITRQVLVPSMWHPVFADNEALRAGRRLVAQLFGSPTAARTYDMLIDKPAGHPHETPWHQDAGYFGRPTAPEGLQVTFRSVQCWLALDDVDADNGCMHFLPGHRATVLEHKVVSGDPDDEGRLIGLVDAGRQVDLSDAVACPLLAGGCTLHLPGTLHYTPPNRSATRPRRAYIFNLDPSDREVHAVEEVVRQHYLEEITARSQSPR